MANPSIDAAFRGLLARKPRPCWGFTLVCTPSAAKNSRSYVAAFRDLLVEVLCSKRDVKLLFMKNILPAMHTMLGRQRAELCGQFVSLN